MKVYLDNAATTAIDPQVLEAMMPYLTQNYGNPSSIHAFGRETKAAIERARKSIAKSLNASVGEIFFTSGGTESANQVIKNAVSGYSLKHIISTKIEHHCVLHPVQELGKSGTVEVHYLNLDKQGNIDFNQLEELLKLHGKETLVALMHANNEIGNMLDIDRVGALCHEHGALFFSDTVQTMAHCDIDVQQTQVHYLQGSAHKFHGPKGVGFVYISSAHQLKPYLHGGAQERNMRAGTENLYGIVGMAKALELANEHAAEEKGYIRGLKEYFWEQLQQAIPGVAINGNYGDNSLYTVLNVSFPKTDTSDFLVYNLDIAGIAASAGSACTSGSDQGSHVLAELPIEEGRTSVRFSFSRLNTKEELDYVIGKLKEFFS